MSAPLLEIRDLSVATAAGLPILRDVSLDVAPCEVVAVVGESGSGKSVTARAALRLLPEALRVTGGAVDFDGQPLLTLPEAGMNAVRGGGIGMLFQQPKSMLDPSARIGAQIAEPLRQHRGLSRAAARREAVALLDSVGIPEPERRARGFAHALSGGMAQRVMIAIALAGAPRLLIADEPTTALDTLVQLQILRLLEQKRRMHDLAILLITHDFAVVSAFADRVVVMRGGRVVETGPKARIMADPKHPYTRGLIQCALMRADCDGRLETLPALEAAP